MSTQLDGDSPSKSPLLKNRHESSYAGRKRRRSSRGNAALKELATHIVDGKRVLFITGAGLSVASGIRPFRTFQESTRADPKTHGVVPTAGLWNDVVWSTATRSAFRKDPVEWYNQFWIPHFMNGRKYSPNPGHTALQKLLESFPSITQITQNIDGLQPPIVSSSSSLSRLIEAHGRVGLFRCIPDEDSDTDSDSDDDETRPVHLGHRRKSREILRELKNPRSCSFTHLDALEADQLEPESVRNVFQAISDGAKSAKRITEIPACPLCNRLVVPLALLFDEGYHSHAFYQFTRMETLLENADVLVFCGTSFAVHLTVTALGVARERELPVYNFNLHDLLSSTVRLNAANIIGPAVETLPRLASTCFEILEEKKSAPS